MSSGDIQTDRLEAPDPELLAEAATSLGELTGDGDIRWVVGKAMQRPRSVVFPLRAEDPSGPSFDAYFKRSYPPPYAEERRLRWEATVREGLGRSMGLEARLAVLFDDEGIAFSRALATDPATLSVVTLAVPGQPIREAWRRFATPGLRGPARQIMHLTGRAAQLIEQCSPDGIVVGPNVQVDAISRRVARVNGILPKATVDGVERCLEELDRDLASSPRSMVYSHGDFSTTNVLIAEGRVGLIDFTWPIRLQGFDVAHFAFRLEYDTATPSWATAPLIDALLEGYGDPEATLRPGWRFVRLSKLLKVAEDGAKGGIGRGSGRARRALSEIESYL